VEFPGPTRKSKECTRGPGAFLLQELCRLTPEQELLDWMKRSITFMVGACDNITPEAFEKVLAGMGIASAGQLADLSLSRELQQTLGKILSWPSRS
jgi:hypothetical protein